MKTKDQIKEWINSKDWAAKYYYNTAKSCNFNITHVSRIMAHELGSSTLSGAFSWAKTAEGHEFWCKIDDEFRDWFHNPEKIEVDEHTSGEILYNLLKAVAIEHGITKIEAKKDDKIFVFKPE